MPSTRAGAPRPPALRTRTVLVIAATALLVSGIAAVVTLNYRRAVDDTLQQVGRRHAALVRTIAVGLEVDLEARIATLDQLRALPSVQQVDLAFLRDRLEQGLAGNPRQVRFEIIRGTARREILAWTPGAEGFRDDATVGDEQWAWAEAAGPDRAVRLWAGAMAGRPHVDIVTPVHDVSVSQVFPIATRRYMGLLVMRVDLAELADSFFEPSAGNVDATLSVVLGQGGERLYAREFGASGPVAAGTGRDEGMSGRGLVAAVAARPLGYDLVETSAGPRVVSWASLEVGGLPLVVRSSAPARVASASTRATFVQQLPSFILLSVALVALAWMFVRGERSEERYRDLVAQAGDGVFVLDRDGTVVDVNEAATSLLGGAAADFVGRSFADCLDPESAGAWRAEFLRLGAGERTSKTWTLVGRSGETVPAEISVSRGTSRRVLVIARDISRRQALEDQLRQSQKMEAVGRLAGGVAHDFNNLLTAIMGYNDLLLDRMAPDDPGRADALEIRKSAQRAATLTRQLLAFGRKQVMRPRVIDINHVIGELDGMLRRLLGEPVQIVFTPSKHLWPVEADPHQLEQVIVNLALNARDAMPGGGRLTLGTENVTLGPDTAAGLSLAPGDYVALCVQDTGHGIDERAQKLLFEPFFTTRPVGKGTGLGLPMVHGIVSQSGGAVQVISRPGAGATFRVYLPRSSKTPGTSAFTPKPPSKASGSETILLAEDDDAVRSLAGEALRRRGYVVLEARLPEEALSIASRALVIDAVVSDVVMPQMTGPALVERLRRARPGLPALFMSGYPDARLRQAGGLPPRSAFVSKPFTAEGLAAALRRLIDRPPSGTRPPSQPAPSNPTVAPEA